MSSLAKEVQHVTEESVTLACVDQEYTGQEPAQAAWQGGIQVRIITGKEDKNSVVLLACPWDIERSFGGVNRFRRLARDYACAITANPGRAALCRLHHPHATQCR